MIDNETGVILGDDTNQLIRVWNADFEQSQRDLAQLGDLDDAMGGVSTFLMALDRPQALAVITDLLSFLEALRGHARINEVFAILERTNREDSGQGDPV